MRKYENKIRKLETAGRPQHIIVAPPECGPQGTAEFEAFYRFTQANSPGTVVIDHPSSGL